VILSRGPRRSEAMSCDQHIGGRSSQQDRILCCASTDQRTKLLVVADGVGGHWGGELAAQTVVEVAQASFDNAPQPPADPVAFLNQLCQNANTEIRTRAQQQSEQAYTTIVALLITQQRAYWAHIGDSRLYCFRNGELVHRTRDHSLVQAMVEQGELTEEAARKHPKRNQLLQVLGMEETVHPDQGETAVTPCMGFILCTDGFWDTANRTQMLEVLTTEDLSFAVARSVRQIAQQAGREGDNVSLAVWRSGPERGLTNLFKSSNHCPA